MHRIIVESFRPEISENAKISGIALIPRKSRNNVFYPIDEVAAQDGRRFQLGWNHDRDTPIIGHGQFHYNAEMEQLSYTAEITDEKFATLARGRPLWVSIDGTVAEQRPWCHPTTKNCMDIAIGLDLQRLDLVEAPGVPETTVQIIENYNPDSSLEHNDSNADLMTKEDKPCKCKESKAKEQECPDGQKWDADAGKCVPVGDSGDEKKENLGGGPDSETAGIDQANPPAPCGDGMKLDGDGNCVPADNTDAGSPVSTAPKESVYNGPNADEINARLKEHKQALDEIKTRINNTAQIDELKAMESSIKKNLYSVTKLSTTGNSFAKDDISYVAQEGKQALLGNPGSYTFNVDLSPEWISEHVHRKKVEEAISVSGQSDSLAAMNDVFVLPGGKHIKSIRDLVKFKEIEQGANEAKFFKGDIPDNSAITEGSVETPGTHTITTVTIQANAVTGVAQEITQAQIEDSPFEIFDYIAQTARAEVLEHEATLVFNTAATAATPGLNINAAGTGAMTASYVSQALEHWETQGYDTSFGNAYIVMHPKQLRELRESTDLTRFMQVGDANITKTGRLTHLYGVELIPSTAINATGNYHAVGGIKGHTFVLASKRDLMIDMRKIPRESAFDWMWTQRKNAVDFDAASFIDIESAL